MRSGDPGCQGGVVSAASGLLHTPCCTPPAAPRCWCPGVGGPVALPWRLALSLPLDTPRRVDWACTVAPRTM